jgi:hypothetical protein
MYNQMKTESDRFTLSLSQPYILLKAITNRKKILKMYGAYLIEQSERGLF